MEVRLARHGTAFKKSQAAIKHVLVFGPSPGGAEAGGRAWQPGAWRWEGGMRAALLTSGDEPEERSGAGLSVPVYNGAVLTRVSPTEHCTAGASASAAERLGGSRSGGSIWIPTPNGEVSGALSTGRAAAGPKQPQQNVQQSSAWGCIAVWGHSVGQTLRLPLPRVRDPLRASPVGSPWVSWGSDTDW